ncbi:hypothetical protein GCM10010294_68920 [Streptomyces griseoloalbus]|nr:hypothetical protein GCM10010294_68920 [Streptomyces griseoloalbus]
MIPLVQGIPPIRSRRGRRRRRPGKLPAVSRDDRHTALAERCRPRILAVLEKDPDRL